nr:MAG TPA: hypothetical protein [Caudoviricetes sp.]
MYLNTTKSKKVFYLNCINLFILYIFFLSMKNTFLYYHTIVFDNELFSKNL